MTVAGIRINGGVQINAGVTLNGSSGSSPTITVTSSDFDNGNGPGGNLGYYATSGDLVCPFYGLYNPNGNIGTRLNSFFTACGYDVNSSWVLNATFASYTPSPGSMNLGGAGYLELPTSGAFDQNTSSFTVECWVYPTAGNQSAWIYNQNTTGFLGLHWGFDRSFNISQNNGPDLINGPGNLPLNTWYHVAMVYDNDTTGNVFLYVNGVSQLAGGATVGGFTSSQDVTVIGAQDVSGAYQLLGALITDFRVTKSVVYTGDFTPSTAPLQTTQTSSTNISAITSGQVQLLLGARSPGAFIKDLAQNITVTNHSSVDFSTDSPVTAVAVSNYSCLIRAQWYATNPSNELHLTVIDQADTRWTNGNPGNATQLTGTFNLPMTLTPYTPGKDMGNAGGWC